MCSHRGRLRVEGVAPGSLAAYSVLFKAGVRCFDTDFVQVGAGGCSRSAVQTFRFKCFACPERKGDECGGAVLRPHRLCAGEGLFKLFACPVQCGTGMGCFDASTPTACGWRLVQRKRCVQLAPARLPPCPTLLHPPAAAAPAAPAVPAQTADGSLLASHPEDLLAAAKGMKGGECWAPELAGGMSTERLPAWG